MTVSTINSAVDGPAKAEALPVRNGNSVATNGRKVAVDAPVDQDEEALPEVRAGHREPLKLSGALDKFEQFDVTPVIGREFVNVDLADWLKAPNADELLRDLAITGTNTPHVRSTNSSISVAARCRLLPQTR
jgi:hypothetical protein